jgi:nucleoside-diphosphate-sugar epimerase
MLEHLNPVPATPDRTVILGAAGFVGGAIAERLRREGDVLALGRTELDLLDGKAEARLKDLLRPTDCLIVVSAKAPCKNVEGLIDNLRMIAPVCAAIAAVKPAHVVYVSSDAVYGDSPEPLTEDSPRAPGTMHGAMHLAREIALADAAPVPLALLRPSLLYGSNDPHNGYGPNRFRRLAAEGKDIILFGEGEERRDHVFIDDVAELATRVVRHRSTGALNIATGTVRSFREIAELIAARSNGRAAVRGSPRQGPMPHNGYRAFDPAATLSAFPDFRYTRLEDGLTRSGG